MTANKSTNLTYTCRVTTSVRKPQVKVVKLLRTGSRFVALISFINTFRTSRRVRQQFSDSCPGRHITASSPHQQTNRPERLSSPSSHINLLSVNVPHTTRFLTLRRFSVPHTGPPVVSGSIYLLSTQNGTV